MSEEIKLRCTAIVNLDHYLRQDCDIMTILGFRLFTNLLNLTKNLS